MTRQPTVTYVDDPAEPLVDPPREPGPLGQALRDPAQRATWVALALAVVGFALLYFGYRGVAATLDVFVQLPYALSGGFGGIALIGCALALVNVQTGRYFEAVAREQDERLAQAWADLQGTTGRLAR